MIVNAHDLIARVERARLLIESIHTQKGQGKVPGASLRVGQFVPIQGWQYRVAVVRPDGVVALQPVRKYR